MRKKYDRLFWMVDGFFRKAGLIFDEQRNAVLGRDIFRGYNSDVVPGDAALKMDMANAATGQWAAHGNAEQHSGKYEIVYIARLTRDLLASFFARHRRTDDTWFQARVTSSCDSFRLVKRF